MATDKITLRRVLQLRREAMTTPTGLYLWDTEQKGFGCRVSPSGSISWLFQRWHGGKGGRLKREVLGQPPGLSLEEARAEAGRLRHDATWTTKPVRSKARVQRERIDLQTPTLAK